MSSEALPDLKIVGYCRACGKALDENTVRTAHGTIFCEEHVPAATTPPPFQSEPSASHGGAQQYSPGPQYSASPYGSPYSNSTPPRVPEAGVSPGLAFVLGLIPGVGAIYNGQYVKGLIHVFILGLMFAIASNDGMNGLEAVMGLMIPGFWAYMAFEAYHTAHKRRLGQAVDEFSGLARNGAASRFPAAPILLIFFGVVFLLNNLELFELRRALRFWPVLMIALGAYLLWARMAGAQKTAPEHRSQEGEQL